MSYILGVNAFHADASAVLLRDGDIVAAAEEERFRRIKHCADFPSKAIDWCLNDVGIELEDLDHIAINSLPKAHLLRKVAYTLGNRPSPAFLFDRWRNKRERSSLASHFLNAFPECNELYL